MNLLITGNPNNVYWLKRRLSMHNEIKIKTCKHRGLSFASFIYKVLWADLIHIFSITPNGIQTNIWHYILRGLQILKKPVVLHWIGTDVTYLNKGKGNIFNKLVTTHLCYSDWLSEELMSLNLEAENLPILPLLNLGQQKQLNKHAFLSYSALGRSSFYGIPYIMEIANAFPEYMFYIVGNVTQKYKRDNVVYLGLVPYDQMVKVYEKVTTLIRLTNHDGLPSMIIEALSYGKQVLWNINFPGCHYVKTVEDCVNTIDNLSSPKINYVGLNFVKENYADDRYITRLITIYKTLGGTYDG